MAIHLHYIIHPLTGYQFSREGIPISQHAAMNGIIHRSLVSAKIPSHLAPSDTIWSLLFWWKEAWEMSMVPWTSRKPLIWDATYWDTYAPSNINNGVAVTGAGAVAKKSAAAQDFQIFTFWLDLCVFFLWQLRLLACILGPHQALKLRGDASKQPQIICIYYYVVLYHWVTMIVWWMFVVFLSQIDC